MLTDMIEVPCASRSPAPNAGTCGNPSQPRDGPTAGAARLGSTCPSGCVERPVWPRHPGNTGQSGERNGPPIRRCRGPKRSERTCHQGPAGSSPTLLRSRRDARSPAGQRRAGQPRSWSPIRSRPTGPPWPPSVASPDRQRLPRRQRSRQRPGQLHRPLRPCRHHDEHRPSRPTVVRAAPGPDAPTPPSTTSRGRERHRIRCSPATVRTAEATRIA